MKKKTKLPKPAEEASAGKKKLRTLLFITLNFIILFTLYQLLLRLQLTIGLYIYMIATVVLAVAYYIVNRGFGRPITDESLLPSFWSAKEKCDYVAEVTARHERARKILYWLFPVVLTLLLDCISVILLDPIKAALTSVTAAVIFLLP